MSEAIKPLEEVRRKIDEIDAALAKVRNPQYNRSLLQAPRVISEKPTSYAGLVSAPQNA